MSKIFNEESSLDKLLDSWKGPVNDPEYVEPVRQEPEQPKNLIAEIPETFKPVSKRKKFMTVPVIITVYDLEYEMKRSLNANNINSIRDDSDKREDDEAATYIAMNSQEDYYEVRETREEILTLISQAIAKLS
jgi:hypothetical protein